MRNIAKLLIVEVWRDLDDGNVSTERLFAMTRERAGRKLGIELDDGDIAEALASHGTEVEPITAFARTGRIVIAGGPRCGKTTLSRRIAAIMGLDLLAVRHTDDLVGVLEWSEASAKVAEWLEAPGPFICEGVAVPRALRKWLAAHDTGAPCDVLLYLTEPFEPLLKGQAAMARGILTVLNEIRPALLARGVQITEGAAPAP